MPCTIVSGSERMTLYADGTIVRRHLYGPGKHFQGSSAWRITGAVTRNNLGGIVQRYSLKDILANPGAIPWRFKNGKQRTFLTDLDHGTRREWRSPTHRVVEGA